MASNANPVSNVDREVEQAMRRRIGAQFPDHVVLGEESESHPGLPAIVFRMSCIYGPHQQGNEDQGWVAHFLIRPLPAEDLPVVHAGAAL